MVALLLLTIIEETQIDLLMMYDRGNIKKFETKRLLLYIYVLYNNDIRNLKEEHLKLCFLSTQYLLWILVRFLNVYIMLYIMNILICT